MSGQTPSCYGKLWDAAKSECRGGNDPTYVNPRTGTNRRDMCRLYGSCSAATNQGRLQEVGKSSPQPPPVAPSIPQVIPPQQLMHRQMVPQPPTMLAPPVPQPMQPPAVQVMAQPQQVQQHVAYVGQMPYTQPVHAATPVLVPMNQPMPGGQVPSFLTVPEPADDDVPVMLRFARTMWRSTCKAAAIGAANFIDYNPIGKPKQG